MKKALLFCAAALFSLIASAGDGLTAVGANIIVLPSSYWDGDIEWSAWTWVYNSGITYGDNGEGDNTNNSRYNYITGEPAEDAEGRLWYEPDFDMGPKEFDVNSDQFDDEGNYLPILWEMQTAPYSTDATFKGRPSYRWTTNSVMADIYVRRTFTTDQLLSGPVYLACGHDDAPAQYYINGELVFEATDGWNNGEFIQLTDEQKALIKLGGEENLIAFHVHQNWGGALADCGLYTKAEGGIDMGYTTPWEGKVLFNNTGGYNRDLQSPSNNPKHPWSALYEAQPGDVYTFTMPGHSDLEDNDWQDLEVLQFKTPIKIVEGNSYRFQARLESDKKFNLVTVRLGDNDDDDIELAYNEVVVPAPTEGEDYEGTLISLEFTGEEVNNFKVAFDFAGGEDGATVSIKEMSLLDITEGDNEEDAVELWVGTHYFNFISMNKRDVKYFYFDETLNDGEGDYREARTEEEIAEAIEYGDIEITYAEADAPEIEGRVETLAWTQADFDDSMWDDQMMPTGSEGYMPELQSIWPSGVLEATEYSSNYWIRRSFELDKINERLSYELNVCHDDVYETYVNGHLLQKNVGWTNGKTPVQVHIPAKYLNIGKNVIATYIQQNWGGYFYDCGINVIEVNFEECAQLVKDAIAYAENVDAILTNRMKADIQAIIDEAKHELATNKDAAELRNYAKEMKAAVDVIVGYSSSVKTLKETWEICRKMEDKGWWGTALDAATAALDTCATASDINKYLNPLRNARKATAMERHTENYVGCVPQIVGQEEIGHPQHMEWDDDEEDYIPTYDNPTYYIYNVGAKGFLGGGESWGAHLAIEYISNPMMVIQADLGEAAPEEGANPVVIIETFRPNGQMGEMDFMNWGGFTDTGERSKWELIPVEGKENVYNIAQYGTASTEAETTYAGITYEPGCRRYLGLRNGDNRYAPSFYVVDTDMHSSEMETNQWMFITREELLGFIANASEENPVDVSFLIQNPGFDQRLSVSDWVFSSGSIFGRGGDHQNFVFEAFNQDTFMMAQKIKPKEKGQALPAGTYVVEVQGYYRDGFEGTHVEKVLNNAPIAQRALIFAGPLLTDEELNIAQSISGISSKCRMQQLAPIHIEANMVPGIGYGAAQGVRTPGTYDGQPLNATDQAGQEYFPCGLYKNYLAFTISEEDSGSATIGIVKDHDDNREEGDWCVMDNWRLKYYGTNVQDPDGIIGIESDEIKNNTTTEKGIYNMLGQKMSKLQKGVNIINGKKVAVK